MKKLILIALFALTAFALSAAPTAEDRAKQRADKVKAQAELTDAQYDDALALYVKLFTEIDSLKADKSLDEAARKKAMASAYSRNGKIIRDLMTPEQKEKFEAAAKAGKDEK